MCSVVLIMLMNSNACEPPNKSVELGRFPSMANGGGYEAVCDFSGVDDHSLPDDRRSRAATVGGAGKVVGEGPASGTPRRGGGGCAEWKDLRTGRLGARAGRSTARRGVRSRNGPLA